jgi:type IV pilus assembly protein PilO
LATNINLHELKNLPLAVKIVLAVLPAVVIIVAFLFLIYSPKQKEINAINAKISKLDNEILTAEAKVRQLDKLKAENRKLKERLERLKAMLPDEKEVSTLLKQISDLGLESGLEITFWKPQPSKVAPSGLYMEIPVSVEMLGNYHHLGLFFSKLSTFKRIVNINDIQLVPYAQKKDKEKAANINIKFRALTFSSVPEVHESEDEKSKKKKDKRQPPTKKQPPKKE